MLGNRASATIAVILLVATPLGGIAAEAAIPPASTAALTLAEVPVAFGGAPAVWSGTEAYIFGGVEGDGEESGDGDRDQVLAFMPSSTGGQVNVLPVTLPFTLSGMAAIWTGEEVYLFGGHTGEETKDTIIRFDPSTMSMAILDERLPTALDQMAWAWDGSHAYLFGGRDSLLTGSDRILRFDPETETIEVLPQLLPKRINSAFASWAGSKIYVFGGVDRTLPCPSNCLSYVGDIVEFDPATGESVLLDSTMPFPAIGKTGGWDGTSVWLFGGTDLPIGRTIMRFDPAPRQIEVLAAELPFQEVYAPTIVLEDCAYIFSGFNPDGSGDPRITRFGPCPFPPPEDMPPTAILMATRVAGSCGVDSFLLDGTQSTDAEGPVTWSWSFDDDQTATGATVTLAYHERGIHVVELTVTDSAGQMDTATQMVYADPRACDDRHGRGGDDGSGYGQVPDADRDGIGDAADNCAGTPNHDQEDEDRDGVGDACDPRPGQPDAFDGEGGNAGFHPDTDRDGVADRSDNCPALPNARQEDMDADRRGDLCDDDQDGDGILDIGTMGLYLDNCPRVANAGQADADRDGIGDACDERPQTPSAADRPLATAAERAPASPFVLGPALIGLVLLSTLLSFFVLRTRRRS